MSNLIKFPDSFAAFRPRHRDKPIEDELGAGISASYGVLSIKGKVFRVKFGGTETALVDQRGRPFQDLNLIIVRASKTKSRTFYVGGFEEGAGKRPTCASSDGSVPDRGVEQPQARTCATCKHAAIGSAVTPEGKAVSACQEHKRVVVVPEGDIANERFGGPMLLRVPPSSLTNLRDYGAALKRLGAEAYEVVTTLSFDVDKAFPKINFEADRPLEDDEYALVEGMRNDPRVDTILADAGDQTAAAPVDTAEDVLPAEQPLSQRAMPQRPAPRAQAPAPQNVTVMPQNGRQEAQRIEVVTSVAHPVENEAPKPRTRRTTSKSALAEAVNEPVAMTPPSGFDDALDAKLNGLI